MSRQRFEYHPLLAYRFIPGLKARVPFEDGGYLIRVNAQGFRCNHDFSPGKSPGTRRVLLFGDSYTAGDGVSNDKRYGDLLERKVDRLQVYNFGLPGTGTDQHYLAYQEFAQGIEHDLLVIALWVENIRRVSSRYRFSMYEGQEVCYAKPYFELMPNGQLALRQVPPAKEPVPTAEMPPNERRHIDRGGRLYGVRRLVRRLGLQDLAQRMTRYQPLPEYDNPDTPAWRILRAILSEWIARYPRPVLVMPLPLYQHIEGSSASSNYQSRFRELARESGCLLHDPLPDLLKYPADQRRAFRFRTDVHLTPAGHEALANSLAPAIERALATQPTT